jgi:hypothetical protein
VKRTKRDIKVEFVGGRLLSEGEADEVRALASSFKPKMHLVMPDWRWLECRGLGESNAAQLVDALRALPGVRFKVNS